MKNDQDKKETGRIEAFSDGVFAIVVTLLILDIKVPREIAPGTLASMLLNQWPVYIAFLLSFLFVGIMWMNHHRLFKVIAKTNDMLLILNGLLLLNITIIPFVTALLAEYIGKPDQGVATIVYTGAFLSMALLFNIIWWYSSSKKNSLLINSVHESFLKTTSRSYLLGLFAYGIAFVLAFLHPTASLSFTIFIAVLFALPHR